MSGACEFSIIVQGPICRGDPGQLSTLDCLRQTRTAYPKAEIILSTWEDFPEAAAFVDIVVVNRDPGALISKNPGTNYLANINRQIVSTRAGLECSNRQYAIKMRSDSYLTRVDLERVIKLSCRSNEWTNIFSQKVVVLDYGCVNPTNYPALFFVSDLFQMGLTKDLLFYWCVPLCPSHWAIANYGRVFGEWELAARHTRYEKMAPEQYLLTSAVRKRGIRIDLDCMTQFDLAGYLRSEITYLGHFSPMPADALGLNLPDRFILRARLNPHLKRSDILVDSKELITKFKLGLKLSVGIFGYVISYARLIYRYVRHTEH